MGRKLSSNEESGNINRLSDFRNYWRDSPDYPIDNMANSTVHYPVDVEYNYDNGRSSKKFHSEMRIYVGAGPDDGRIDIDDTDKVDINSFHLSFNPAFQKYAYEKSDHSLVVTDSSDKMGGKYEVRMTPAMRKPR
ncbi:hypothetical protein [Methylobacterium sp. WL19]|uniref:hypothetical protein n=1 Tax=Methylobacterium sp. WL19 TaxID=2603896 RepID=UPI0011CAA9FD|nr:hypothetical protein [Methylobacterium sp. WL19]TXN27398.1 hypothetical protein FV220_11590 [Methylobacterium sp. WL19]